MIGEEECVDELALAARLLGHEGDREALAHEALLEVHEARGGLLVDEARRHRPAAERGERSRHVVAPVLERLEAHLERMRLPGERARRAHRWQVGQ